jgi:hypothetical protein
MRAKIEVKSIKIRDDFLFIFKKTSTVRQFIIDAK